MENRLSRDRKEDIIKKLREIQEREQISQRASGNQQQQQKREEGEDLEQSGAYRSWDQMLGDSVFQRGTQEEQPSARATIKPTLEQIKEKLQSSLERNEEINQKLQQTQKDFELKYEREQEQEGEQDNHNNNPLQYFPRRKVEKQELNVAALMFGQNSGALPVSGRSRSLDEERPFLDYQVSTTSRLPELAQQQHQHQQVRQEDEENFQSTYREIILKDFLERQKNHQQFPEKQLARKTENEYLQQLNYPFQPQIHPLPHEIYNRQLEISKQEQWERLLKTKVETHQEREILKLQVEAEEMQRVCSFKPQLNPLSQILSTQRSRSLERVEDRLYKQGLEKRLNDEILARQKQEEQFAKLSFRPAVNVQLRGEKALNRKPIYERVEQVLEEKKQELQSLKNQLEEQNQQHSQFRPNLNAKSIQLSEKRLQEGGGENQKVFERLAEDAIRKVERRMKLQEEFQQEQSQQCPFQPSIPNLEQQGEERNPFAVSERQYLMADILREKLEQKVRESLAQLSFRPEINKVSEYLVESDAARQNETAQQKVERLAIRDKEKNEMTKEQIQKAYYEQFSFQPELNPTSKLLAKGHQIQDSLEEHKKKQEKKKQQQLENQQRELEDCSFVPKTNKKKQFQHLQSDYRYSAELAKNLNEQNLKKQKKIEQLKSMREYDELRECTFRPTTNQGDISRFLQQDQLIIEVRGIDKFLEMKDKKRRQEQEQRERESQIFCYDKRYDASKHETHTQPQPFKLSKNQKKQFLLLREELERQEKENCTFHPKTNESKNKQIIRQILSEQTEPNQ